MKPIVVILFLFLSSNVFSQKPSDGNYTNNIEFAEWENKQTGVTCTVKIKGDSIWVLHNGNSKLSGKKGEIIDNGLIVKQKTGKWIIAHLPGDKKAGEIGGCSDGPRVINFKRRKIWLC